jgi:hypothetical protein
VTQPLSNHAASTGFATIESLLAGLRADGTHPEVERWRATAEHALADYARRGVDEADAVERIQSAFALGAGLLAELAREARRES